MAEIFETYFVELIFGGSILVLLLTILVINIVNSIKIKKLNKKYESFMKDVDGNNLEYLIEKCIKETSEVKEKARETENKLNSVERNVFQCIHKIGIVRYNAFDNVGSDLSFCVALLDSYDTGVVLSGIYSRDNSMTYAKPITSGKSKYPLSAEEMQALEIAKKNNREIMYTSSKS